MGAGRRFTGLFVLALALSAPAPVVGQQCTSCPPLVQGQFPDGLTNVPYYELLVICQTHMCGCYYGTLPYAACDGNVPPGTSCTVWNDGYGGYVRVDGVPTTPGLYCFDVEMGWDPDILCMQEQQCITIASSNCIPYRIQPQLLPKGRVGVGYGIQLSADGGSPPHFYRVSIGTLPPGITFTNAGYLGGVPGATGTFRFTVEARDSELCAATRDYALVVDDCDAIVVTPSLPDRLPDGSQDAAYTATLAASGGTAPYLFSAYSGSLPPGVTLSPQGGITGTPTAAGDFGLDVVVSDAFGCSDVASIAMSVRARAGFVAGHGPAAPNDNRVRLYSRDGGLMALELVAYGASWGTNVAAASLSGDLEDEAVTGPGPGAVLGPHVRAFSRTGVPLGKVNFFSYGTLRYGVNVGAGDVDGDAFSEILTAPGPGDVFGPHVRGWNVDGAVASPMPGLSFFAYGTLRYGANVDAGDVAGTGRDAVLTGPGPGSAFGPTVRAFAYDGSVAQLFGFDASPLRYGARVAGGDADADRVAEIAAAPGAGPANPASFRGFRYDGATVVSIPGFEATPYASLYGGQLGLGDVDGDGNEDLLAAPGPDSAADSTIRTFALRWFGLAPLPVVFPAFPSSAYGASVDAGAYGY